MIFVHSPLTPGRIKKLIILTVQKNMFSGRKTKGKGLCSPNKYDTLSIQPHTTKCFAYSSFPWVTILTYFKPRENTSFQHRKNRACKINSISLLRRGSSCFIHACLRIVRCPQWWGAIYGNVPQLYSHCISFFILFPLLLWNTISWILCRVWQGCRLLSVGTSIKPWMLKQLSSCRALLRDKIKYRYKKIRHVICVFLSKLVLLHQHLVERPETQASNVPQIPIPIEELAWVPTTQGNLGNKQSSCHTPSIHFWYLYFKNLNVQKWGLYLLLAWVIGCGNK